MIPVSNKTRGITRVRYKHASFQRQEKYDYNSYNSRAATCAVRRMFVCRACVSDDDVKTRLIAESSRREMTETKSAAILHQCPRRHHHPDHLHRPYRLRPHCLCRIVALL